MPFSPKPRNPQLPLLSTTSFPKVIMAAPFLQVAEYNHLLAVCIVVVFTVTLTLPAFIIGYWVAV
jgi:hypothetical protein